MVGEEQGTDMVGEKVEESAPFSVSTDKGQCNAGEIDELVEETSEIMDDFASRIVEMGSKRNTDKEAAVEEEEEEAVGDDAEVEAGAQLEEASGENSWFSGKKDELACELAEALGEWTQAADEDVASVARDRVVAARAA